MNQLSSPLISIIIPVYNGGYPFICSLLALERSTFKDWELIVVDDGSTDESAAIASKFGAKVLQTTGREGPGAARNIEENTYVLSMPIVRYVMILSPFWLKHSNLDRK